MVLVDGAAVAAASLAVLAMLESIKGTRWRRRGMRRVEMEDLLHLIGKHAGALIPCRQSGRFVLNCQGTCRVKGSSAVSRSTAMHTSSIGLSLIRMTLFQDAQKGAEVTLEVIQRELER